MTRGKKDKKLEKLQRHFSWGKKGPNVELENLNQESDFLYFTQRTRFVQPKSKGHLSRSLKFLPLPGFNWQKNRLPQLTKRTPFKIRTTLRVQTDRELLHTELVFQDMSFMDNWLSASMQKLWERIRS